MPHFPVNRIFAFLVFFLLLSQSNYSISASTIPANNSVVSNASSDKVLVNSKVVDPIDFGVAALTTSSLKNALVEYKYDDIGRITQVWVNNVLVIDYTLDDVNNRTQTLYKEVQP
jgi:hypothetical protein